MPYILSIAVPEVVLGQDEVEAVRQAGVVVPAEPAEGALRGPAATRMGRRAPLRDLPHPGVGLGQGVHPEGQPLRQAGIVPQQAECPQEASGATAPEAHLAVGEAVQALGEAIAGAMRRE